MRYSRIHALVILVALASVPLVVAQTRSDVFDATQLAVTELVAHPLPDGGCSVRWCGGVASSDGGVSLQGCTEEFDLKGTANQNRCAALSAAGLNRLGRSLRFDVDAGSP